ncbi:type II secretion system protein GspJ [Stakelama saccharophila]|uniref:Type II secretion system protein J n=1 Tax=Stakelama saccharophila TaxID=3075605 RepID=A0ABZ0BC69_9SPHN|nr:type II secretion system protein GspJ [Stakelama sp. W311]WNO54797.1 type II secretion system protein GspJ [Stakelama sp. W311]
MIPHREQGFTLIEVMISLGLFALIAVAGLGLVDSVLNVQGKTEAHLDRLDAYRRAMFIIDSDFDQIARGGISGDTDSVQFVRAAPGFGGPPVPVRYDLRGGALTRIAGARPQLVLPGVRTGRWRYFYDGAWTDHWPPNAELKEVRPRAVAVEMQVARGTLRRVVSLPHRPAGEETE